MPQTLPSEAADQAALYSTLVNRRVSIRHNAAATTGVTLAKRPRSPFRKVRVQDISQGGIALIVRQAPEVGESVLLQMHNRLLDFSFDLAAAVRHRRPHGRGSWLVGLEFDRTLSLAELASLL